MLQAMVVEHANRFTLIQKSQFESVTVKSISDTFHRVEKRTGIINVVVPKERFVTYEESDLEWMLYFGMAIPWSYVSQFDSTVRANHK
jgi:hypothetical protein